MSVRKLKDERQFSGTFLFVNSDAEHLGTSKHRVAINSHVQSQYHRWRRQETSRKLRVPKKRPIKPAQPPVASPGSSHGPSEPSYSMTEQTESQALLRQTREHNAERDRLQQALMPRPVNILAKGNSDPFQSTAVAITPEVNRLLAFSRDWLIPSMFILETSTEVQSYSKVSAFDVGVFALQDLCHGNAYLTVLAIVLASATGDNALMMDAMRLKAQSTNMLRLRLRGEVDPVIDHLHEIICSLFCAELALRNIAAATFHVTTLCKLIEAKGGFDSVDPGFRERALYVDTHFACIFLTRPYLSVTDWMPGYLDMPWTDLLSSPHPEAGNTQMRILHSSIIGPTLRQVFLDLTELLEIDLLLTRHIYLSTNALFRWMYLRKLEIENRLVNHYLDLIAAASNRQPHASLYDETDSHLVQACACLALLYWSGLAFENRHQSHGGLPYPDNLHNAISVCRVFDPELRLWIMYVGAMMGELTPRAVQSGNWYTEQFLSQVTALQLRSWPEIRQVLRQFAYSELLLPDQSEWFCRKILSWPITSLQCSETAVISPSAALQHPQLWET